jgi:predicted RNA-binding protein YlxR (DUF448 family)
MKKHEPIRMCISCRKRELQKKLIRLRKDGDSLRFHQGVGRSFYLCKECLKNDKHLLKKIVGRLKLNLEDTQEFFKELKSNVES